MSFMIFFNIIAINKRCIFNFNYYIFRFNVSFICENSNIENVIRCLRFFFFICEVAKFSFI